MRRTPLVLASLTVIALACSRSTSPSTGGPPAPAEGTTVTGDVSLAKAPPMRYPESAKAPNPDPRIGLAPGEAAGQAGEAAFNMKLLSNSPAPEGFTGRGATGSDLAFSGNYIIQGNYRGIIIWDGTNPRAPKLVSSFLCPTSQGDPTVYGNLLFVSGEGLGARNDCGSTPDHRYGEPRAIPRRSHLRHQRQVQAAPDHQRADLSRLAHQLARCRTRTTRTTSTCT